MTTWLPFPSSSHASVTSMAARILPSPLAMAAVAAGTGSMAYWISPDSSLAEISEASAKTSSTSSPITSSFSCSK